MENNGLKIKNSKVGQIKTYRNVVITDSQIEDYCSIGDDTTVERSRFGRNVVINRRSYVNDSVIGMYTYTGINSTINWSKIGKFCSLGRNVDIGGIDHDYKKFSTMPLFRLNQMKKGGGSLLSFPEVQEYCEIGNDVWIAAGVHVLNNIKIGDGAVIGAGSVVTHDIPAYAVAVGAPARVISYRCSNNQIERLLKIKWWDWPLDLLIDHLEILIEQDITDENISILEKIAENQFK